MSLRARILLLVLVATLLPAFATIGILFQQRDIDVAEARTQLAQRAEGFGDDIDDKIAGTAQLLFGLGSAPVLDSPDKTACSAFLAEVLKEHPQYTGLLTILPGGDVHCDSLRSGRVLNVADREYFQRALESPSHVVQPVFGRITGIAVLQIARAVRDAGGAVKFVLLASLNLDHYARSLAGTMPYPGVVFQVWDHAGTILVREPDDARGLKGKPFPDAQVSGVVLTRGRRGAHTFDADDGARIWSVATLKRTRGTGLRVTLDMPKAELYKQANRQLVDAMLWLVALSLLICGSAVAFAEFSVRRQASRLTLAVSRIDAGDFGARIGAPYPRGELGEVMAALDRTAASLEAQRSEIERTNSKLVTQANYDALTGLANRNLLGDRIEQALIHAGRAKCNAAVMMLDLDRFKSVNDSLGHNQGDALLKEIAHRLASCVRKGDTVARLGGDEFVIVLGDMTQAADAAPVGQKVLAAVAAPLEISGREINGSASIGISSYPDDGTSAESLLRNADVAMYRAKEQGGNRYEFYTAEMNARVIDRIEIEAGLRGAIERGELLLHYQPIVDARTGRISGAEALVRWQHPEKGLVPPIRFIPVAEESGLIVAIGDWVLNAACTQISTWRAAGLSPLRVAVNLSGRQFADRALAANIGRLLERTGCEASSLELEITESTIMHDPEAALLTMHRVNELGIRLSIDDFGTGYSSLAYLKRFPVHKLKIDRSFVRDIHVDSDDASIVGAIAALAKKLNLKIVAEGVETAEQLKFLESLGCDECQGYLFSKPIPAEEFAHILKAELDAALAPAHPASHGSENPRAGPAGSHRGNFRIVN